MLKVGDILAETYRIEKLLNRGGFGRVWLAFDTILNRDVAIKELIEVDESRTVGTFASNDVVIDNSLVSRRHCVIIRESKEQWLLLDLQSTNGTKINGQWVRRKYLTAGNYDLEVAGAFLKLGLY